MIRPLFAAWLAVAPLPAAAQIEVDLELVLAVDVSTSVDFREYVQQMNGYAAAFADDQVVSAILGAPRGVAVAMVQWAAEGQQVITQDWALLRTRADCYALSARFDRQARQLFGDTHVGDAITVSLAMLADDRYRGMRQVIDVSGDGVSKVRPTRAARDLALAAGVTINALAVLDDRVGPFRPDNRNVYEFYATSVIGGPGAFVMTADGFDDFARAIRRKLIREISIFNLADAQ